MLDKSLTVILVLIISGFLGYSIGVSTTTTRLNLKAEKIENDQIRKLNEDLVTISEANTALTKENLVLQENYNREEKNAKTANDNLARSMRAGADRLSVAVASCKVNTAQDASAPGGFVREERAELLPEISESLIRRIGEANQEVRRTNQCIDHYNSARKEIDAVADKLR